MRQRHGQSEYGDVVKVIAYLANHLSDPGVAVIAILTQEFKEFAHQGRRPSLQLNSVAASNAAFALPVMNDRSVPSTIRLPPPAISSRA